VVLRSERNLGFGGGCNIGIRLALERGVDYVLLVNNDARVFPETIGHLVEVAETRADVGLVGGVLLNPSHGRSLQMWGGGWINLWSGRSGSFRAPVDWQRLDYVAGACLLIRARALREIGLFDDRSFFMYCEDADLAFRAKERGWKLAVADRARVLHKGQASLRGDDRLVARYVAQSLIAFFLKHSRVPLIPIAVNTVWQLGASIAHFRLDKLGPAVRGRLDGWRAYKRVTDDRRSSRPLSYSS
jgi:GT2 family glycosyltransferase